MTHIEVLEAIAQCYGRPRFLEIGTGDGGCFHRVARHCRAAVTVDVPDNPNGDVARHEDELRAAGVEVVEYWGGGSDNFFACPLDVREFDLVFIDGSHWYDQVRRDFDNAAELLAPLGTIAMHDTWSATPEEAAMGSDEAYLVAEEVEADPRWQAYTMPVRPGLTLCRRDERRFT